MTHPTTPPPPAPEPAEPAPVEKAPRLMLWTLLQRVGRTVSICLAHETLPQMAAALAYRTVFSLIPLLFLSLLVMRLFSDTDALVRSQLEKFLELTGLKQLVSTDAGGFSLEQWLKGVIDKFGSISFTGIGLVSAATLIYAAISLIIEIETSFNTIYGVSRGRAWGRRVTQYWLMVSLGSILVCASFMVGDQFRSIATTLAAQSGEIVGSSTSATLVSIAGFLVTVVISAVLLVMLYTTIPNARVKILPALYGAFVAATLLEGAKYGFSMYLARAGYATLYGTLALVPLFLLWIYLTWLIVLLGLRISYLIQQGRTGLLLAAWRGSVVPRGSRSKFGDAWPDPMVAVGIAATVARAFEKGRTLTEDALAEQARMEPAMVQRVLQHLAAERVVVRVATDHGHHAWTMARPAESVRVADLVRTAHAMLPAPAGIAGPEVAVPAVATLTDSLRAAQIAAAGSKTLADLLPVPSQPAASATPAAVPAPG